MTRRTVAADNVMAYTWESSKLAEYMVVQKEHQREKKGIAEEAIYD